MIVYLDASALVKRYVAEAGSAAVGKLIDQAEALGTSVISRAEVSAAFAKAVRVKFVARDAAATAMKLFAADWTHFIRLQLTETLAARAASLAWEHGLRGYDAVHLATALVWHETLGQPVLVATFDRQLWQAAQATGLIAWPKA
ncbi:MAG: type II toxin-antitoxin system VapC family toxin [Pseudomonadota bacterium]